MPIVQAYQCPRTDELFISLKKYRKHLRALARDSLARRKRDRALAEAFAEVAPLFRCTNFGQIRDWMMANPEKIFWYGVHRDCLSYPLERSSKPSRLAKEAARFRFKSIEFRVRWDDCVSNSHNAPIDGVTNWCGRTKGAPRGYPGWSGTFKYELEEEDPFSFDLLDALRMPNGTASGNGKSRQGGISFFADDWPEMAVMRKLLED